MYKTHIILQYVIVIFEFCIKKIIKLKAVYNVWHRNYTCFQYALTKRDIKIYIINISKLKKMFKVHFRQNGFTIWKLYNETELQFSYQSC